MSGVEAIADDARASVALTTQEVLERVKVVINETRDLKSLHWLATDHLPDGIDAEWSDPEVHGETLAFLQYTSGSTGTPKGVMLSHANLMHNSAMISYAFEHTRSGMGVFWLPSYHDMGLIGGILQPLYCGRPNVLFSPTSFLQKPFRWLQAITRYRGTVSGGPNFAYDLCVDKVTDEQKKQLDLRTWSLAFNGAEPIRPATLERFVAAFECCGFQPEAFYPCYGLAEATLMVSGGFKTAPVVVRRFDAEALEHHHVVEVKADDQAVRELVGSGGNLLDQKIVIVDPDSQTRCPDNRVGEVWVSGPSIAEGYWQRSADTEAIFKARLADSKEGPFLRTGDLGFLVDGELFITGRLKDLIIIRGVNYYPQDIEFTVESAHMGLRASAGAAFVVQEEGRERLVIVHEAARRRDLDFKAIFAAIRAKVATEHDLAVDAIVLLRAGRIPKTSSGKIQRHACRDGYQRGTLAAVAQWRAIDRQEATTTEADAPTQTGDAAAQGPAATKTGDGEAVAAPRDRRASTTEIVFQHVREIAKERSGNLTLDTNIVELGLDSLERMEIIAALQETFGGRFPEEILPDMETCGQVVDAVQRYLGDAAAGEALQTPTTRRPDDAIEPACYQFDQFPEVVKLKKTRDLLESAGLVNPYFHVHDGVSRDTTRVDGQQLINFSSFNYLGMSGDPVVAQAAKRAINEFGTSVSASRLVSGEKSLHRELEQAVTDFIGVDDAISFVGGHATNETTIGHLLGPGDLILHDELAHNSIIQGCILSGARRRPFPHNDYRACEALLAEHRRDYRRVLVAIEGVYSMDGDYSDLAGFVEVKRKHKALLLIDEAHSIGTMGPHGRGMAEMFDVDPSDVDLWMGTYSKALGSTGGYIAGCQDVIDYLKYTAPGFVFATGLAPSNAAAALAAIRLLEEEPERVASLARNASLFLRLARDRGLDTGASKGTPIIPVIIGSSAKCLLLSQRMQERGINVQPILHPAVEEKATRLRFFINSTHTEPQIRTTVDIMAEEMAKVDRDGGLKVARRSAKARDSLGPSRPR
ncbi:MAG: aminotransferase class I/II-fold pyridoxal phosphate-dependent enzyme [Pirellulales bacterium]